MNMKKVPKKDQAKVRNNSGNRAGLCTLKWNTLFSHIPGLFDIYIFTETVSWNILLDGKTKLSGNAANGAASIAYRVEENTFIVAASGGKFLKMVKIQVTGETTFEWIEAKYHKPSSDSTCKSQLSFDLDCFHGTPMTVKSYNVVLLAEKISGIQISMS